MFTRTLFLSIFFTTSLFAGNFPVLNYSIPGINYSDGVGQASMNGESFQIRYVEEGLLFEPSDPGSSLEATTWENVPAFIRELEEFKVVNAALDSKKSGFRVDLGSLEGKNKNNKLTIKGAYLSCENSGKFEDPIEQYVDSCFSNSTLGLELFKNDELSFSHLDAGSQSLKMIKALQRSLSREKAATAMEVSAMDIKIKSGVLSGSMKLPIQGSNRKIKIKGETNYRPENKHLVIKISKISYLFFNVTNQFFEQMESLSSEKLVVDQPYIYIALD